MGNTNCPVCKLPVGESKHFCHLCRAAGREPGDLRVAVSLRNPQPGDVSRLADAGVEEMVLVASPPGDPIAAEAWVANLARQWMWVLN